MKIISIYKFIFKIRSDKLHAQAWKVVERCDGAYCGCFVAIIMCSSYVEIVVGGNDIFLVVDDQWLLYGGRGADGYLMHGHFYILVVIVVLVATPVLWWMLVMWICTIIDWYW